MEAAAPPANERRRVRRGRSRVQIPAFGNWDDYDQQHHHVPITQCFDYCSKTPLHLHSAARTPYAHAYTGYVNEVDLFAPELDQLHHGVYDYNYNAALQPQHHFDYYNKTSVAVGEEVKGGSGESRRQRRRRSYLDNINRKVFDVTEEATIATSVPTGSVYGRNDAVMNVTSDLYDVASVDKKSWKSNAKDEDLYKIPPELLRKSKPKKMRRLFTKCFATICASY